MSVSIASIFIALNVIGRLMLTILPNISPVAPLTMLGGYIGGPLAGFLIGFLSMLISDMFIGVGPWTLVTSFFMGLLGVIGFYIGKFSKDRVIVLVLGYLSVLLYDISTSVILMYSFGVPPFIAILNLFLPVSILVPYPMGPVHEITSSLLFLALINSLNSYIGDVYGEIV